MAVFEDMSCTMDRRRFLGGAIATGALTALAGCSGGSGSGSGAAKGNVMTYYTSEPSFIDPYNSADTTGAAVMKAVFDTLVVWDFEASELKPLAAEELPQVSDDGLTYTFKLREGMTFHNGDPVDAASFKRGWERLADPTMKTPSTVGYHLAPVAGYAEMAAGDAKEISGLKVVDDLTFQVTLTSPMADFPVVCTHVSLSPVPQAALDDPTSFLTQPIGNGPFKLDEPWKHNEYISLSRFDDYYGDKPKLDGAYFSIQADPKTAYTSFTADELDFSIIPSGQIQDTIKEYGESDDGYTVTPGKQTLTGTQMATYFFFFNTKDPVMSDVNLRRAISLGINRQNIVDALFEGTRKVADTVMPPSIDDDEGNAWQYSVYDPDQAKQILDQYYPADADGKRDISITIDYNAGTGQDNLISSEQSDLEKLGITVTQNGTEWATYLQNMSDGKFQFARLGWTADYPTQDNFLYPNFYSTADNNYCKYENPDVDKALEEARQIQDDDERRAKYREICKMIGDDMPIAPIMFYSHNYVGTKSIKTFTLDPQVMPHFETAELA